MLERLGVPPRQKVKELSKGSRVKAELALALAHRPRLLVLDEPTSGIDPLVRGEVLHQLAETAADGEGAVLFSTHITEDVDRIADRVVFLVGGQVRLSAEREQLRESWQELWVDVRGLGPARPAGDGWDAWLGSEAVLRVEPAGAGCVRVVTGDAGALLQEPGGRLRLSLLRQRPLRLAEVLALLVEESRHGAKVGQGAWPS